MGFWGFNRNPLLNLAHWKSKIHKNCCTVGPRLSESQLSEPSIIRILDYPNSVSDCSIRVFRHQVNILLE